MPEQDYSVEEELRKLKEDYGRLLEENQGLQGRVDELDAQVESSGFSPEQMRKIILCANTPRNNRPGKPQSDFDEWQRGLEDVYRKKYEIGLGTALGFGFEIAFQLTMKYNPGLHERPFAYLDFSSRKSFATPSTFSLLDMIQRTNLQQDEILAKIGDNGEIAVLRTFNRAKTRKDRDKRVIRQGEVKWNYTDIATPNGKDLTLATYPFVYLGNPVGVGVFFYDSTDMIQKTHDANPPLQNRELYEQAVERIAEVLRNMKE